ncbi:MAG: hypothetical protein LBE82_09690 [Chitinophagaceae bacterium]|jgi:hypothetical protein|nr:hypothetical protein [Chitinophagaceae bacterium]
MDSFKKYLQQHRSQLDTDEPGENVWNNIRQKLEQSERKKLKLFPVIKWAVAASVLLLAGVGAIHLLEKKENSVPQKEIAQQQNTGVKPNETGALDTFRNPENVAAQTDTDKQDFSINKNTAARIKKEKPRKAPEQPEENTLHIEMAGFIQVINAQKTFINKTPLYAESPAYFAEFKNQLKQLDDDEKSLRNEIRKTGLSPASLDRLLNIYQQKILVLKQLQIEIKKTNDLYKQSRKAHDALPDSSIYFMNL